ncbi:MULTISPECIES: protein translocase subunit SecF [unclassified Brevibacterium]|uniref:protein translocase subunit SecF n=1 Tax=unclassified Brevibacterium TaxID=2614124 RepID=UPI001BAB9197|nr:MULTISPECIES: protein translocase subunit SecF [unclassified Brevibacterium]QUL80336.1 protein translocase subunit SecF [Brevibacterium sp. SMBL_HHYL_HB1]HJA59816.1 protein translocase subunit SecF [Candidatus Brevibacterium intestinavium]
MKRFFAWGNRLHNGETSIPFVGKAKLWLTIAGALVILSLLVPLFAGFNFGIAFKGGSQFQIDQVTDTSAPKGEDIVNDAVSGAEPRLTPTSDTAVQIETNQLSDDEMQQVRDALVSGYDVPKEDVTSTFVGPEWGQDVTEKMVRALVIFVAIAMIVMALYFRTWKMSLAAILGLVAVMIVTMGIYSATGIEVTPEAVIGFLTVLSFSLYDTVVVFDKIRENTTRFKDKRDLKFSELVNLGVNQTTVRSINTTVVSVLPVASILFIGVLALNAGTLIDISLSLFIGMIVAASSTLFVASPLYALLRAHEPDVREQEEAVRELRLKNGQDDVPPVIHAEV